MDRLTTQHLQELWQHDDTPCISIFLPGPAPGSDAQQGAITLKNLLREAQSRLVTQGHREAEVRVWLTPLEALVGQRAFWRDGWAGLALFRSPSLLRPYRLAIRPPERLETSARFHTRPLLAALRAELSYYILAASTNRVRLFHATSHDVTEHPLPESVRSLAAFQRYDNVQQDQQFRQEGGATYSHGGAELDRKDVQRRFLREVATAVECRLNGSGEPLVFAGVAPLFALYREVSRHPGLVEATVTGSPDEIKPEALRVTAQPHVAALREAAREAMAADYRRLVGTGRTAADLGTVLQAARSGQVSTLFLAPEMERWGLLQMDLPPEVHAAPQPEDEELLDAAARLTVQRGGRVEALPPSLHEQPEIVDGVAALLRF